MIVGGGGSSVQRIARDGLRTNFLLRIVQQIVLHTLVVQFTRVVYSQCVASDGFSIRIIYLYKLRYRDRLSMLVGIFC